jgi:shikimate dehydrogenase
MIRGAVLGFPIHHSLSPTLHHSAFSELGIVGKYEAIEVKSGELENFLNIRGQEFDYLSLTMPLKEEVLNLKVELSAEVVKSQSGNTLIKENDVWTCHTTDGRGFLSALSSKSFTQFGNVLMLGAGGTARSLCASLDGRADTITVLGRSLSRKDALARIVTHSKFVYKEWNDKCDIGGFSLVVNTTPSGAADMFAENLISTYEALLFDVIYQPWPTKLGSRWMDLGGEAVSGLELLLYQGIHQLELVLNKKLDDPVFAESLRSALSKARS